MYIWPKADLTFYFIVITPFKTPQWSERLNLSTHRYCPMPGNQAKESIHWTVSKMPGSTKILDDSTFSFFFTMILHILLNFFIFNLLLGASPFSLTILELLERKNLKEKCLVRVSSYYFL